MEPSLSHCANSSHLSSFESHTKFALGVVFLTATIISYNMVFDGITRYNYLERTNTTTINSKDLSVVIATIDYRWVTIPSLLESMSVLTFSIGTFQFIACQVPYSMRGLIMGTAYLMIPLFAAIGITISIPFKITNVYLGYWSYQWRILVCTVITYY